MNTGPLNLNALAAFTQAIRSKLSTKDASPATTAGATGATISDQAAYGATDERYRAFANAQPLSFAAEPARTSSNWLSGRQLNGILDAVKRHLGGRIPAGTTVVIRPRPGGNPGHFTVQVALRGGRPTPPAPKPPGNLGGRDGFPMPTPPINGGGQGKTPVLTPPTPPVIGKPQIGIPQTGKPEVGRPDAGGPRTGKPDTGKPETGKPETGKPEIPPGEVAVPSTPEEIAKALTGPLPTLPAPASGPDAKQNDLRNRAELNRAITSDPALSAAFRNWESLPQSARLDAGQRISDIMGQIYGFDPSTVTVDSSLSGSSVKGYFSPPDKLAVSPDILSNPARFADVVSHEQAHVYQTEKVDDLKSGRMSSDDPLKATAQDWADNFDHYYGGSDYERYRSQPVEQHAWATGQSVGSSVSSLIRG